MDITALTTALATHQYLAAVGLVLLALVSVGKLPVAAPLWLRLPAWSRPLVPVVLGIVAALADALAAGKPWLPALVGGIVFALPALLAALPSQVIHAQTVVVQPSADPAHVVLTRTSQTTKPE